LICQQPFSQITLNQGSNCFLCDDPNCVNCNLSNPSLCLKCITGYGIINGTCEWRCSQFQCTQCSLTNSNICSQCVEYYYVNPANSKCSLCPNAPKCLYCYSPNPSWCVLCAIGFFLSSGQCYPCPAYCSSCTSVTICTTLANPVGYALITVNNASMLTACDPGCVTCSSNNPSKCSNCSQGYVLKSGVCFPCPLSSNC